MSHVSPCCVLGHFRLSFHGHAFDDAWSSRNCSLKALRPKKEGKKESVRFPAIPIESEALRRALRGLHLTQHHSKGINEQRQPARTLETRSATLSVLRLEPCSSNCPAVCPAECLGKTFRSTPTDLHNAITVPNLHCQKLKDTQTK